MPALVPLATAPEPEFVAQLQAAWARGDAVLPVDHRWPQVIDAPALADGDALVVPTSGTSGEPRGVVLTHEAVLASARATSARLEVEPDRDCWLSALPLGHIGGLAVVLRALLLDVPLTFDWDAPEATLVSLVPTQLERVDAARFRRVLLGGSADWRSRDRPPNVVHTYGMTETGSGVVYDGVPLDGVTVRVEEGQILVRGPMLLRCYADGADPKTADGWLPTGDAGGLDDDGRLHVDGRMGDVIVTGGEKVWPDAVERVLRTCPGVAEVAVAGRADAEWGQRVVAWVVPADAAAPPALDALRGAVKEALPPWCAPKELVLAESLPKTALGKVQRARLH